jgi:hypothetical protein
LQEEGASPKVFTTGEKTRGLAKEKALPLITIKIVLEKNETIKERRAIGEQPHAPIVS